MEVKKNITAVEWLEQKGLEGFISPEDFEKAKEMEREQNDKYYQQGYANGYTNRVYGNK